MKLCKSNSASIIKPIQAFDEALSKGGFENGKAKSELHVECHQEQ